MNNPETSVLLFDGVCNLCNSLVRFIINRDPKMKFSFAALQSEIGQALLKNLGLPIDNFDTLVFIKKNQYFLKSSAVLNVLKETGGIWKLLYIFIIIPLPLRDFIYNIVAKSRYKIFGRQNSCMLPVPEIKHRFLS